jgi:N-hydroxyarylamine O-acetyltransferase
LSYISAVTHSIDLDAYCARIGYRGSRQPSLETLNGLVWHHVQSIPFENLDVLLGRRIDLDQRAIEQKLIQVRRGGYCFEQNTLLLHVLEEMGFRVTPLSARVRLQRPRDMTPPRTHLFLRLEIEGLSYLADVGVGGLSPTAALRLAVDIEQATPHEPRRILCDGAWAELDLRGPHARLFHQAYFAGAWHDVCEFTLEPMPAIDREVSNWFTSTHPQSHFRDRLMVARATPTGRVAVLNRELTVRAQNGQSQSRHLGSKAELLDALAEHFGIELPRDTRFAIPELAGLA